MSSRLVSGENLSFEKTSALSSQKAFFTKQNDLSRSLVVASYEMVLLLAKKKKPFADGEEILKPALEITACWLTSTLKQN